MGEKLNLEEHNDNLTDITERYKLPEGARIMEIETNSEIISAETAVFKLESEGYVINGSARDMLTKVNWKEKLNKSYEIVSVSVGELFGDEEQHTYAEIKAKAKEFGLELIPQALAPEIRMNYDRNGSWANVAMECIIDTDDTDIRFFCCGRNVSDSVSYLASHIGVDSYPWNSNRSFFFSRK